ncbi:unnamed protein product [Arabidopsis halleri]
MIPRAFPEEYQNLTLSEFVALQELTDDHMYGPPLGTYRLIRGAHCTHPHSPEAATTGDFEPIGLSRRNHHWTGHEARDRGAAFCPDRPRPPPTGLAPGRPLHVFHHAIRSSGDQIIGRHHSQRYGDCYPQEVMSVDVYPNNYPFRNHESFVPRREATEEKLMEIMH